MDVIVVGAGLGGLAAAVGLHRAGHAVRVLERSPHLRESGAGIGIMPNGVLALDALGLGEPVRSRARAVRGGFRDRLGRPLLVADQAAVSRAVGAPLAVVPRRWLQALLAAALPEGTIRFDSPVVAVADGSGGVAVDGGPAADLLVAADGAASRVRASLFPDHPGLRGSGEHAARAIAVVPPDLPLAPGELLDRRTGDRFGCLPMDEPGGPRPAGAGTAVYWYSTWRASAPDDPAARRRWLADRRRDWHPCAAALIDATPVDDVHVVETAQVARPLPALALGRVALLGDAAHAMTPDLGQGACQAFEDAVALVDAVAEADDVPAALARYDAARGPRTAALQGRCLRTHRLLTLRGPVAALRDAVMRAVPERAATRALVSQLRFDPSSPAGGEPGPRSTGAGRVVPR